MKHHGNSSRKLAYQPRASQGVQNVMTTSMHGAAYIPFMANELCREVLKNNGAKDKNRLGLIYSGACRTLHGCKKEQL